MADQTLNNENVVTPENATALLEAMRQATIAEEKKAFEENLQREQAKNREARAAQAKQTRQAKSEVVLATSQQDDAIAAARILHAQRVDSVQSIALWTTRTVRTFDVLGTGLILLIALGAVVNWATGWLAKSPLWSVWIAALLGVFAVYHGIMNALGRPKIGLTTLLNLMARRLFRHRITSAGLNDLVNFDAVKYDNGRITVATEAPRINA